MRVVLLGPPGAGKGTQANLLAEHFGVPHISTGDLFRANIGQETALGLEAKSYLDTGDLVPSDLTNRMVQERVHEPDATIGFFLDGYPRTVEQANALEDILKGLGTKIDKVLAFVVDDEAVIHRMLARGRSDDTEDVIRNRMRVYHDETEPLLDHYEAVEVQVDAMGSIEEVNRRAQAALEG